MGVRDSMGQKMMTFVKDSKRSRSSTRRTSAGLPKVSRQREPRATVIDVGDIHPGCPVAEGTMADHLDLVVHAFQGAVGDADTGPRQDPIQMAPEHPRQFLKGLEAAVAGAPEPRSEEHTSELQSRPHL